MDYAVDFVLIPPKEIITKIIKLNRKLKRDYNDTRIVLDKEKCFPHISLLMGILPEENLPLAQKILTQIDLTAQRINLSLTNLVSEDIPAKDRTLKIAGFELSKSGLLYKLHEDILKKIRPYLLEKNISKEMMYGSFEIDEKDTPWMFPYIKNFKKNSSGKKFNPHITIGDGEVKKPDYLPLSFTADRLAICHLGNYCTCRKILIEEKLEKN